MNDQLTPVHIVNDFFDKIAGTIKDAFFTSSFTCIGNYVNSNRTWPEFFSTPFISLGNVQ